MNILFVLTSHDQLGNTGDKTGFWVEEFAAPFYALADNGANITLVSPAGGQPPIDPKSELADFQTEATRRFDNDAEAKAVLANTTKLADINSADFDAIFYPGGHGPLWDLASDVDSIKLIESFYQQQKPIAVVCHASAVLLNATDGNGQPLIAGKEVTGFSNSEEAAVGLTEVVPFLLEDELKEKKAIYKRAEDWSAFAVQDGLLISGQNPASSTAVAELLLQQLQS